MDVGTILVVLSGVLVVGILAWQAWTGMLADGWRGHRVAPQVVATRPDLRPLPRGVRALGGAPRRAA